jgi:ABC-type multidrug transport system permease subunit
LWATLSGTMLAAAMMALQLFAASQRAGNIITLTVIFPLMMLGGSFFPFEIMPRWMAAVGMWTPNGWALQRLKDIVLERVDGGGFLVSLGILVGIIVGLLGLCTARLRRGFAQG